MSIRVTFTDTEARDAFANRFKLDSSVGENQLDIDWHLLQFAKLDDKALDYDEVAVLTASPGANAEREFIVKGDPVTFGPYATVIKELPKGFYLVKTTDGTLLSDHVDSIEHNSSPMKFVAVSTVNELNGDQFTGDINSVDAQWPRLRVISRYRPLQKSWATIETNKVSKPELILMDSGIDFDHAEFNYDGLDKEDFYTLPAYNGNFRDDVGHGTATASMAVGLNLGVCHHAKLVNVKIGGKVDGQPHNATLLEVGEAIDAILDRISKDPLTTRVINMSWGIARSAWLDSKVESLQTAGATVVCAAGNSGISVEDISPAGIDSVITVGSIDKYDIPSGFNNISPSDTGLVTGSGLSLDIFAPGENVIIAEMGNRYAVASGTSFSAPLVSGVAVEIAALYPSLIPNAQLKSTLLSTATTEALLFEDDRFSEDQNRLVYLMSSDEQNNIKSENQLLYLGHIGASESSIVADMNSHAPLKTWSNVFPDIVGDWSYTFVDPSQKDLYSKYVTLDPKTGVLTIENPVDVVLPETIKLVIVELKISCKTQYMTHNAPLVFFFHSNPAFKDTISSDISLALTDTNSISFYRFWGFFIK